MRTVTAINGHEQTTLTALEKAAAKATGKARAAILARLRALSTQPAARGRSAKKEASLKKHTKRAPKKAARKHHRKHTTKHNPTTAPRKARKFTAKAKGMLDNFKSLDAVGIAKDVALTMGGSLGTSFLDRQAARLLPNLNPYLRTAAAALVTGFAAVAVLGKEHGRPVLIGSASQLAATVAQQVAPGLFAGADDEAEAVGALAGPGYWDEAGQWVPMAGIAYDLEQTEGIAYRDGSEGLTADRPDWI